MSKSLKCKKSESFVFRRWQKKSFAAFNSLGKVVVIATLNVIYFGSLGNVEAQESSEGQPAISKNVDLEEVEVVAETSPQLASEAARIVEVISRKEIQAASAQSVNELLEFALGVDIRQRGPHGIQADVSVRGGTFDQVMFLLNGINVTDPQTGHFNLNIPVDISSIERIEILEGPGARYWGPNAFTGAINIVTKKVKNNTLGVALAGGEFGLVNGNVEAGFVNGNVNHYFSVGGRHSDGYIPNADYNLFNAYYNRIGATELGTSMLQVGYTDKAFGANTFYTPSYPFQYEQNRTFFGSFKYETAGETVRFSPAVYFRQNHDRFELYREEGYFQKTDDGFRVMGTDTVPGWYAGHNYHTTTIMGGELNGKYYSLAGITSFGINVRNEQIYSNVLGTPMDVTRPAPGEPDGMFTKSANRLNASAFVEHFYSKGIFSGSAGVMANHNSTLTKYAEFYPGLDIAFQLAKPLKAYGSATTSFRMPTFTDLYYTGPNNVGNPNLKPETAVNLEAGLKFSKPGLQGTAAAYYRMGKNLIDWVQLDPDDLKFTTVNHNEANTLGIELGGKWNPQVTYGENFFITNVILNYTYLNTEVDLKGLQSGYVGDYLKHKFTARVSHNIVSALSAHWGVRFQDRAGQYDKFENGVNVGPTDYAPFWLMDLKIAWTKPKYEVYAQASNLLDNEYVDFGNIAQPGRWIIGGVKFNISY